MTGWEGIKMNYKRITGPWPADRADQAQALADALQFATMHRNLEGLNQEPLAAFVQLLIYKAVDIMDNAAQDHGAEYNQAPVELDEIQHAAYNMDPVAIYTADAEKIRDDLGAFEALRLALTCHYDMLGYYPGTDDPSNWQDLLEFIEEPGHLVDKLGYFLGGGILHQARDIAAEAEQTSDEPRNAAVKAALLQILGSISSPESVAIYEGWGV